MSRPPLSPNQRAVAAFEAAVRALSEDVGLGPDPLPYLIRRYHNAKADLYAALGLVYVIPEEEGE